MSYISGFMLGAAIGKSARQLFGGTPVRQAVPRLAIPSVGGLKRGVIAAGQRAGHYASRAAAAAHLTAGFRLEHACPGRRRYRARLSPGQAKLLAACLPKLAFLKDVQVNAKTGGLLFLYDEADKAQMDLLADFLRESIFRGRIARQVADNAIPLEAHAGALTKSVRGGVRDFSRWIQKESYGWLDISSLAFLLFLLRGLRKMIIHKQYPSGAQMLWWAVSMMRGWRTV